jgi:enoyl-CoA hydratase/carnithine racemase
VSDPVAVVTTNRPTALNAFTEQLGSELRDAMLRANADPAVVGIVLTGAGRAFCAGADMTGWPTCRRTIRPPPGWRHPNLQRRRLAPAISPGGSRTSWRSTSP